MAIYAKKMTMGLWHVLKYHFVISQKLDILGNPKNGDPKRDSLG
jgi:hypothetical protein